VASDVSIAMADNVNRFKVCVPDSTSTMILIQKVIAFVNKNPKYTLASTAFQMMLAQGVPVRQVSASGKVPAPQRVPPRALFKAGGSLLGSRSRRPYFADHFTCRAKTAWSLGETGALGVDVTSSATLAWPT
jgi:hypothetical protein